MKNKTVILVSQYTKQPAYTGDMRNYDWSRHLINSGNTVYILCSSLIHGTDKDLLEDHEQMKIVKDPSGINYVYVKTPLYLDNGLSRVKNMFSFYPIAMKALKKLPKPDIMIAKSPNPMSCVAAIMHAKKCKVPCVCDIVDLWPESIAVYKGISAKNPLMRILYMGEKWIYKNATSVIFSMPGGYDYIKSKRWNKQISRKKVFNVNTGVNLEQFDENKKNYVYEDSILKNKDLFKVVYTGSVRTVNNLKLLVDAGKIIQDKGLKDIFIMIHGFGDQVEELKEYCACNGIENVKLYGKIEKHDIPNVLSNSDLCVLCYQNTPLLRFGGSMNKMFEYFASGKPIIANAKMGRSIIKAYNCGVELNSNDPNELANEIIRFYSMKDEERAAYGARGRQAAEDYDIHKLTEKMEKILDCSIAAYDRRKR